MWTALGAVSVMVIVDPLPGSVVSSCLPSDRSRGRRRRLGVAEVAGRLRAQARIELVDQWDAGRDVQLEDSIFGQAVEVLHERAQRVAVGGHEHRLAGLEVRDD